MKTTIPQPEETSATGWQIELKFVQTFSTVADADLTRDQAMAAAVDEFNRVLENGTVQKVYGDPIEVYVTATAVEFPEDDQLPVDYPDEFEL